MVVKDTNFESLVKISVLEFNELKKGDLQKLYICTRR